MNVHSPISDSVDVNMTSKGQVLIPKAIRDRIGLQPGKPVVVAINDRDQVVVLTPEEARRHSEKPEERRARIHAAIEAVAGRYDFGGGTTDEIMRDLRGGDARP
jgi:AbrB family looped-hinge helix DNA binding protein